MDGLRVTYLGQCGFLLEANGIRIVTDPYLSNSVDKEANGWHRAYEPPCTLEELRPDCIIISHSHDDHMDSVTLDAYRKAGGNATIAAPAPETALLGKLGFSRIIGARAEHGFNVKGAVITPIACAHTLLDIDEIGRFRNLSYFIDFGDNCVFFGGDMSLYDGLEERIALENCSMLLLPCNGRDEERTSQGIIGNITAEEASCLATHLNVPFIPMHHDLYEANGCSVEEIMHAAETAGAHIIVLKPGEYVDFEDEDELDDDV